MLRLILLSSARLASANAAYAQDGSRIICDPIERALRSPVPIHSVFVGLLIANPTASRPSQFQTVDWALPGTIVRYRVGESLYGAQKTGEVVKVHHHEITELSQQGTVFPKLQQGSAYIIIGHRLQRSTDSFSAIGDRCGVLPATPANRAAVRERLVPVLKAREAPAD